ncbi:HEAT repeat domain-containing protein, partial [Kamptonema animale CS-326]|uniref:NACHT domain-containing protein n=1 Tax=Kamptonema animale TaxID=92934 RepID=UPI00232A7DDD
MGKIRDRGVSATPEGLTKLKLAKVRGKDENGTPLSYERLAVQAAVSDKTVKRFFGGQAVDRETAIAICNALDLDINKIVDPKECNPPDPDPLEINWSQICRDILTEQQKKQRLRRQATELGCELNVYVPLGLLERKQQQRRNECVPKDDVYQLNPQVIVKDYENQQFLTEVIQGGNDQRLAIIGEPGAGKTTLLDKIASWIDDNNLGLPICIPLGGLQGETLAGYLLKIWLKQAAKSEATQENLAASLEQQFRAGKVWLLLDAVDEMAAASPAEALAKIRDELVGWVAEARVVLTCRLNVWDASVNNALPGFETYRTLEFKPEQVDEFIGEWFAKAQEKNSLGNCLRKGEKLLAKLKETNRANIYNLVRSPLRLALLCQTFYVSLDEELPETQAMLYERFIRYFYEWKQEQHSTTRAQRQQLNQVLGELAKAGIESESRFRLRESWAIQLMGESEFELGCQLGWLNLVDREAKTDEAVYAFFHPTFQEYFAAKAIEDWHFFLHHVPDNPKLGSYRIFERRWKEVMLLWVGRDDVSVERKEGFIKALVEFEDGFNCEFYWYRSVFVAAVLIAEFKDCSLADAIVAQIVKWGFGYFNVEKQEWRTFRDPIEEEAKEVLKETEREKSITALVELIRTSQNESTRMQAVKSLGEIDKDNPVAISALVELIRTSQNEYTQRQAVKSLGQIGKDNPVAISALVELIRTSQNEYTRMQAVESLGEIDKDNPVAISALVE